MAIGWTGSVGLPPFCSLIGVCGMTSSLGSTMLTWSGRGRLGPIFPVGSHGSMILTLIPSTPERKNEGVEKTRKNSHLLTKIKSFQMKLLSENIIAYTYAWKKLRNVTKENGQNNSISWLEDSFHFGMILILLITKIFQHLGTALKSLTSSYKSTSMLEKLTSFLYFFFALWCNGN